MLIKSHIKTIAGFLALALLPAGAIGTTALAAGAGSGSPPPTVSQTTDPNDNGSGAAVIPDDENDADKAVLASDEDLAAPAAGARAFSWPWQKKRGKPPEKAENGQNKRGGNHSFREKKQ